MLDLLIRGADVVDGTGAARRRADVGVRAGRVVAIGDVDEPASRVVDADGLVLCPGFVDIHTHYDAQALWDPACTPSPFHGVTTVVGGNCGFTIAPIEDSETDYITRMLARVEGMPLESLQAAVKYDWRTFGEYLDRLDGALSVNAGFLVGHSALRRVVMGSEAVGNESTPEQLDAMKRLLAESLTAGGLGFSSSQAPTHNDADGNPVPSRSANRDELVALCRVVRDHPGTTLEFIPSVGGFSEHDLALMTDMSLAANRPLNWNVLVPNSARPEAAWTMLESGSYAAERGARVVGLTVPDAVRSHLCFLSGFVFDAIPGWEKTMGLPPAEKMRALADPAERRRLQEAVNSPAAGVFRGFANWETFSIVQTFAPENEGLVGRTVGDIAEERGQEPFDALLDIVLLDDLRTVIHPRVQGEDQASWELRRDVWRDGRAVVGASDAGAHLDMLSTFNYSTAMLQACREHDLVPVEEAVHLITDVQARLYGIRERGRIEEGWYADLVLFDEATVGPEPVYTRHDLPAGAGRLYAGAEGVERVFVNGTEIVTGKELTGDTPGTLLRSGRDTETVEVPGGASA
jgi:N-acyl-D-aspartate/D-glutamate deacylase